MHLCRIVKPIVSAVTHFPSGDGLAWPLASNPAFPALGELYRRRVSIGWMPQDAQVHRSACIEALSDLIRGPRAACFDQHNI
jgi:hypothetical protein